MHGVERGERLQAATSFMKDKKVLVSDKQKVVFYAVCFPVSRCLVVVLRLDYKLLQLKARIKKNLHDAEGQGEHVPFFRTRKHSETTCFMASRKLPMPMSERSPSMSSLYMDNISARRVRAD